jgi:predicted O-methyltransferase YrrM
MSETARPVDGPASGNGTTDGGADPQAELRDIDEAAHETMLSYITGMWVTQVVRAAADLSLAEHLEEGLTSSAEVARAESADPDSVYRLMRACVALELLALDPADSRFAPTPLLATLRANAPSSLRSMALAMPAPGHWLPWGHFPETVRTGRSQADAALGSDLWTYFSEHREEGRLFGTAMLNLSSPVIGDAVPVIETTGVDVVADIGGADGAFVLALLENQPGIAGIVVDLPHAAPGAQAEVTRRGLSDRVEVRSGDFFDAVPEADLYLLKFVLHDWDDRSCERILTNCRRAMRPGGRVIVVEMVIDEAGRSLAATQMDMAMLAATQGMERTVTEFDELFVAAGLRRTSVTPLRDCYRILETVADL